MEVLNKSGRFKRGTYKPLHANNKLTLTKVLIKKINNESNFRKWVGKMAEREGLPLYIANHEFDPASECITLYFKNYKFYTNLVTVCKKHKYNQEYLEPILLEAPPKQNSSNSGAPAASVAAPAEKVVSVADAIESTLVLPPESLFTEYVKANYNTFTNSISFNDLKTYTVGNSSYVINWNSIDTAKKLCNALKLHAIGCAEMFFEGLGMTTLRALSRLNKCCPALIHVSVKNNQIQDVNEIEQLSNLRLKGFDTEGNPIRASPEEINRVIRKTFPLIVTGKPARFYVFDAVEMQMLPQPKFNMVDEKKCPHTEESRRINAVAVNFMKMLKFNRFSRADIDNNYDPNATVSIIEDRMYARSTSYTLGRKWTFVNKEYIKGADNISEFLARKLKGKFCITEDCYIVDYTVIDSSLCLLVINGFIRQIESAFSRSIVFHVNPQGKPLILNDNINIWRERGPNIISFLNPESAISDNTALANASAITSNAPPSILTSMPPDDARLIEMLSAKSGIPIDVVIDYIKNFGKTKEQAEQDFSNPTIVDEIKRRIKAHSSQTRK